MTDQEENINLGKIVFDDNNQDKKSWSCLRQTCSRSLIVFLSQLFVIFLSSSVAFGEITFQKLVTSQLSGLEFCVLQQDTICPHQDYEQVNFYKKSSLYSNGWSLRNWKIAVDLQLAKRGTFQTKFDKIYSFINFLNLFTLLCKKKSKISSWCVE